MEVDRLIVNSENNNKIKDIFAEISLNEKFHTYSLQASVADMYGKVTIPLSIKFAIIILPI